jgi:hypothetical protein
MRIKKNILIVLSVFIYTTTVFSQDTSSDNKIKKHFIGTSLLLLANLTPNQPDYYQINYGYRFTPKDAILVDIVTWKLSSPKGVPLYSSTDKKYPGFLRESGFDIGYQRFLWKGLNTSIHVTPLFQNFIKEDNVKIQNGFQIFLSLRFGYHINFFKNRMFIEPTLAFNYWPITTNEPESFKTIDKPGPNYLLFDPNIHIGIFF